MQHNDSKHYINQLALKELQNELTITNNAVIAKANKRNSSIA
jgi:type IV secretory pathway VirD2 relaxase